MACAIYRWFSLVTYLGHFKALVLKPVVFSEFDNLKSIDGDVEVEDLFAIAAAVSGAFQVVTSQHGQAAFDCNNWWTFNQFYNFCTHLTPVTSRWRFQMNFLSIWSRHGSVRGFCGAIWTEILIWCLDFRIECRSPSGGRRLWFPSCAWWSGWTLRRTRSSRAAARSRAPSGVMPVSWLVKISYHYEELTINTRVKSLVWNLIGFKVSAFC